MPSDLSFLKILEVYVLKNVGELIAPCLTPFRMVNCLLSQFSHFTNTIYFLYAVITILIIIGGIAFLKSNLNKTECLILSYALLQSANMT